MANPFLQRLFGGFPLSGTGGFNGNQSFPPPWSTPPFVPAPGQQQRPPLMYPTRSTVGQPPAQTQQPLVPTYGKGVPPWLQKLSGGLNKFTGHLAGVQNNPGLSPQENDALAQRQRMTMIGALLAGSGPAPQGTRGVLQPFGEAMLASQQAGSDFTADALRAKLMQAQIEQARTGAEDPAAIREMRALGYPLTQEGYKAYQAAQAAKTQISIGEKLDEPIPIGSIDSVRTPDGKPVPIGTTYAEARAMGAQVQSPAETQRNQQADQALGVLGQLEELAIGPNGIFNEVQPGLASRVAGAIDFGLSMIEQDDPRASQFFDMSKATLAPFIKFLGESGALAQGDVDRALGLLPRVFPLPDTKEVATEKFKALREIINRGVSQLKPGASPQQIPPLPEGYTLDPE